MHAIQVKLVIWNELPCKYPITTTWPKFLHSQFSPTWYSSLDGQSKFCSFPIILSQYKNPTLFLALIGQTKKKAMTIKITFFCKKIAPMFRCSLKLQLNKNISLRFKLKFILFYSFLGKKQKPINIWIRLTILKIV